MATFCQLCTVQLCLFKADPFYVIWFGGFVNWVCLSPPQHHDNGGAPEVPAEEMSSGV